MHQRDHVFFPGLNGLRAIAALAVVASHTTVALDTFGLNPRIIGSLPNGNPKGIDLSDFAVSIFFALSGFLITYLLVREQESGGIRIKNFYIRRILRIWPLYYFFYLLASATIEIWDLPDQPHLAVFYIFFSPNIPKVFQIKSELLGHYWSLGVEEYFYLFWPWIVLGCYRILNKVTLALLVLLVGAKLGVHVIFHGSLAESVFHINRFDCMMIGALGAIWYHQRLAWFVALARNGWVQAVSWTCIALTAVNRFHIANVLDHEFISGVTVLLIIGQIEAPVKVLNLENRPLDFLGKISFGIYVYHPLVLFFVPKIYAFDTAAPTAAHYIWPYAGVMGGTVLVAYLSYEFMEKRFLKMKKQFSKPDAGKSPGNAAPNQQPQPAA